jgi:hypothetical protein
MGTFRDRGEQVGAPERANYSVLNWKVTCARPVTLVDGSFQFTSLGLDGVRVATRLVGQQKVQASLIATDARYTTIRLFFIPRKPT